MANTLLSISWITHQAAMILKNTPKFANCCARGYDSRFAEAGAKKGNTISIRKPIRPVGREGMVAKYDDINEPYVQLSLDHTFGVDLNYNTVDLTLSMDDFTRRYLEPAVARIANYIDEQGLLLYNQFPWMVGTPGAIPNTRLTYTTAGAILTEEGAPSNDDLRSLILTPMSMATITEASATIFNPQPTISEQYVTARMPEARKALGWRWMEDGNVISHTCGPIGGTPAVNGANQSGSTLLTSGWTASGPRLVKGDVFTIVGVYAVNPMSRRNTGRLRQFVVTAPVTSDSGGLASVSISPDIIGPNADGTVSQFQTVATLPAAGALLTVNNGAAANTISLQNVGFYRDAIVMGMADLEYPRGAVRADRVSDPESGISIRVVEYYDGPTDIDGVRLDIIFGFCVVYPSLCVRVAA